MVLEVMKRPARLMAEEIAKRHPEMEREAGVRVDEIMWESVVRAVKKVCMGMESSSSG